MVRPLPCTSTNEPTPDSDRATGSHGRALQRTANETPRRMHPHWIDAHRIRAFIQHLSWE